MADAVTSQLLVDGEKTAVMKFTNISDGTGESAVLKVDVSSLAVNSQGRTCTEVRIDSIKASVYGMSVNILWDATTDVTAFVAGGDNWMDYDCPPIINNAGAGVTGDILFSTVGATTGDTYTIILYMTKLYG